MEYRLVHSMEIALIALAHWLEDWPEGEDFDISSAIKVSGWEWVKERDGWEFQARLPDHVQYLTLFDWIDKLEELVGKNKESSIDLH